MIQVEPQSNFEGFGLGTKQGEYHFSLNMKKSQYGIVPAWAMQASVNSSTLTGMGYFNWITQFNTTPLSSDFAVDSTGAIYQYNPNASGWALAYKPGTQTKGNGLITDQKNRLLYIGTRYIGMYDPTLSNYTTGTVALTLGSPNVVGTGTTFTAGMVGKRFQIANDTTFYTVATFTDATHIALSTNYAGGTASGLSYTIYSAWTDQWKDFGADISPTTQLMQADSYESYVLIAYGNKVALISMVDDSFNSDAFDIPSGMTFTSMRSGTNGLLLSATFQNRSALILWDAFSARSIAPWKWINATVQSIVANDDGNWIVITDKNVFFTNGYSTPSYVQSQPPISIPDKRLNAAGLTLTTPQSALVNDGYLFIANSGTFPYGRIKNCVLALNLSSFLWEEITPSTGHSANVTFGALFQDNGAYNLWVSYQTSTPNKAYVDSLSNGAPTSATFISSVFGSASTNNKTAQAVKLEMGMNPLSYDTYPITMNVTCKIMACKRPLWGYGTTNSTSASNSVLNVNGTLSGLNQPQVGDEIIIMEGSNAGLVAHVTGFVNQGLSNQQIQLDTVLPNLTESSVAFGVTPFKRVATQTLTSLAQLRELWFNVSNKYQGKKFLVKLIFDNINHVAPELRSTTLIYDDLGAM